MDKTSILRNWTAKDFADLLPKLYTYDGVGYDKTPLKIKFFHPTSSWTWYPTEFDGEDTFFGYVEGFEKELGYFSLAELQSIESPLPIEVDKWFQECSLFDLYK